MNDTSQFIPQAPVPSAEHSPQNVYYYKHEMAVSSLNDRNLQYLVLGYNDLLKKKMSGFSPTE